jgi:hypothetical protein
MCSKDLDNPTYDLFKKPGCYKQLRSMGVCGPIELKLCKNVHDT